MAERQSRKPTQLSKTIDFLNEHPTLRNNALALLGGAILGGIVEQAVFHGGLQDLAIGAGIGAASMFTITTVLVG